MEISAWFDRVALDLRHSLRVLRKSPVFTTAAVLSLALGIGANTAIFSIVHAVLLKALPVEEPEQLVQVTFGEVRRDRTSFTNPIWEQIRDRQQVFDGTFAFSLARFDVGTGLDKQFVESVYVSGDFFATLGVPAFAGRLLTADDDRRGGGTAGWVAVLSHAYWRERYRASLEALGATIHLAGHPFTIVGVAPPGFLGASVGNRFDVAVPLAAEGVISGTGSMLDRRGNWWVRIMARLKPGQSLEQAQAGLRALAPQIREATMPEQLDAKGRADYLTDPLRLVPAATGASSLRAGYGTALLTLMGAVALVLLIACANLANLLLARASARRKEFALRLALGASRARLVRQLLTESLLLALGGAAFGLLFARWASGLIVQQMSSQISSARSAIALDLSMDWSVLGFTMLLATLTACLFGLAPAVRSTDLGANALLRGSSRSVAAGWRGFTLEKLLVVVQMAVSLVLVVGAALFVRSFASLATLDPGFDRRQLLVVTADLRNAADVPAERRRANAARIVEAWRALPGVTSIAATTQIPITNNQWGGSVTVRDRQTGAVREGMVLMNKVGPGYFATMGTPIYAGRDFTAHDTAGTPAVVIVNESFARTFYPDVSPIGQICDVADVPGKAAQIVGVVKDSKYLDMRQAAPATAYLAMGQFSAAPRYFVVRATGDTAALTRSMTEAVRELHLTYALEFRAFEAIVQDSLTQERLLALLSGFFGALALLVAAIGLYGVMSLAVSRRRQEIGIRMALGAAPRSVVSMVLRDVIVVTVVGLAIGTLSGVLSGRLVATLLFGLAPSDVTTWLIAIAALGAAAALAGYLPARRAARLDPMLALRED